MEEEASGKDPDRFYPLECILLVIEQEEGLQHPKHTSTHAHSDNDLLCVDSDVNDNSF